MQFIFSSPFFRLVLPLGLGIVASTYWGVNLPSWTLYLAFIFLLIFHFLANRKLRLIPYFSYVLTAFIFVTGVLITDNAEQKAKNTFALPKETVVVAEISQTPKINEKFVRTQINIEATKVGDNWQAFDGKCLLLLQSDSLSVNLKPGDKITFKSNFKEVPPQNNPDAFNYKRYLFFHLISHQCFLKSNQWKKINSSKAWYKLAWLSGFREKLLQTYQEFGISGDAFSVLSALTLGYKNELDYDIQKAYAASGAIHVLAVSGLHVGIVFVILNYLLMFFKRNNFQRWIYLILLLLGIWAFALLTGGSPSVLRASLMFSFIALGQALKRNGNIYNSIFASAFLLLILYPFLLFDISFQLSYLAVISIVFFQPKISSLIQSRYSIVQKIWDLTSVGIAAQIGTFPVTVYYFHQFPNYFLLSNFIVIPIAGVLIWLSLAFFLSLIYTPLAHFFAWLLKWTVTLQNYLIQNIEQLPYALSENLFLDAYQLGLLVLSILFLMMLTDKAKFKYAFGLLLILTTLGGYSSYRIWKIQHQKKIIVYDVRQETAINFIDGREHILLSSLPPESKQKEFLMHKNFLALGLKKEKHISCKISNNPISTDTITNDKHPNFFYKHPFLQFYDKRILLLNNPQQLNHFKPLKMHLDYLIIGGNLRVDIAKVLLYFELENIIIDSSHSNRNIEFWTRQKKLYPKKNIHIVRVDGAFITDV